MRWWHRLRQVILTGGQAAATQPSEPLREGVNQRSDEAAGAGESPPEESWVKLIVGLGNPGRKYEATRHNIGFDVLAELLSRDGSPRPKRAFDGETADVRLGSERAILLWPHTFMNASGRSVRQARDFYKLTNDDLLIICDDLNLPPGKLRLRPQGSAGGQKGLADIIRHLGTEQFARLRVGIGQPVGSREAKDYVLGRFSQNEHAEIQLAIKLAADAAQSWACHGVQQTMNQYN